MSESTDWDRCFYCGGEFAPFPHKNSRNFCSAACIDAQRAEDGEGT